MMDRKRPKQTLLKLDYVCCRGSFSTATYPTLSIQNRQGGSGSSSILSEIELAFSAVDCGVSSTREEASFMVNLSRR